MNIKISWDVFAFCSSVLVLSILQFFYSLFKCEKLIKVIKLQKKHIIKVLTLNIYHSTFIRILFLVQFTISDFW